MTASDTYGDTTGEYFALRNRAGLVIDQHELVWASGADAVPFLQDILSQEVESLAPSSVARSLLLSPRGKLRSLLWVLRGPERVGMLSDYGDGAIVVEELERLRIRVDVELEADMREVSELWGPGSAEVLRTADLPIPEGWTERDGVTVVAFPLGPLPRFAVVGVDRADLARAGARPAGRIAVTAVRTEAGEPQMGRDVDTKTIPQEAGLVDGAISLEKGCYLGQELVARIESRGHVNRRLLGVTLDEAVLPPEGAAVVAGETTVGTLTSVAESLAVQAPVGMALLRREVSVGDPVIIRWESGQAAGRVRKLPLDDFTLS